MDLRRRIAATRWPDRETVNDRSQGIQLAKLQELVRYWGTEYDWRKAEAKLNAFPQFVTEIDGLDIHFIHVRSRHANALPLIMTHGWPGSVFELLKTVGPLTDPDVAWRKRRGCFRPRSALDAGLRVLRQAERHGLEPRPHRASLGGADEAPRVHPLRRPGRRLGFPRLERDGAPGAGGIARHPHQLAGDGTARRGGGARQRRACAGGTVREGTRGVRLARYVLQEVPGLRRHDGHAAAGDRPGLDGLSGGACGLMYDYNNGEPERLLARDDFLDNVTLYWLTNSATSSARLYWETSGQSVILAAAQKTSEISLPVAITVFPDEVYRAPETWARRAYRNLIYFNEVDKGGHFAAWEEPELFSAELRAAFRSLRPAH